MAVNKFQRIFIADPSLEDWIGHHAPYDFSVKSEAATRGLKCEVLANSGFHFADTDLDGIFPVFSHTAWGKRTSKTGNLLKRDIPSYFMARVILIVYDFSIGLLRKCRRTCSLASTSTSTPSENPCSEQHSAPIFNAVRHVSPNTSLTPLQRKQCRLKEYAANSSHLRRLYHLIFDTFANYPVPRIAAWLAALRAIENYYEARRHLIERNFGKGDILFGHMVTGYGFAAWALISEWATKQGGNVVVLMRYPVRFIPIHEISSKLACRTYEQLFANGNLRIATDSKLLAIEYAKYLAVPMEVYPIPHVIRNSARSTELGGPLKCVSLGNARAEKGILDILDAIRLLENSGQIDLFQFELQINDPDPECAGPLSAFLEEYHPSVITRSSPLSGSEYEQLLSSADVVLLPYWSSVYDSRTSGVLIEAIASSKPVITTENTWLSLEATNFGTGLIVGSRDPASIAAALIKLKRNYSNYSLLASNAAHLCLNEHNPRNFLNALLGQMSRKDSRPNRNVLVAYPFPNLFDAKSGNSVRVRYLLDFLSQHDYYPTVLAVDQLIESGSTPLSGIKITTYPQDRPRHVSRFFWLAISRLGHIIGHWHQVWIVSMFSRHKYDRPFRLALNKSLIGQSAVFVEYAFDVRYIEPFTRALRIPLIATAHDRHSAIGSCGRFAKIIEVLEVDSLSRANFVATVSPVESDWFSEHHVNNHCIPNPCDVDRIPEPSDGLIPSIASLDRLKVSKYFLFLGSAYSPNFLAKEQLKHLANEIQRRGLPWNVVVVGSCANVSETNGNFIAMGLVDDDVRTALYRNCEMVLSPLPYGSGASLKTVEAMAMGTPVLGSGATFRGLAVTNGVECFIEDNIDNYLDRIVAIIDDIELKATVVKNAYQLARRYDYRFVYRTYLQFLEEAT